MCNVTHLLSDKARPGTSAAPESLHLITVPHCPPCREKSILHRSHISQWDSISSVRGSIPEKKSIKVPFFCFFVFCLCWVFVSVRGLSPVVVSGGRSSSRCAGLSLSRPLLLRSTGSRRAGSAVVAHGPSRSVACGILPDQGSNPCPLHQQADSQPLRQQGSPLGTLYLRLIQ